MAHGQVAAPSPVTATPGDGVVTLSWDAVAGATSYLVYRSSTSGGPYTQASNPFSGTSLTLGQSVNTPCYYVVVSRNDGGTSAYSNEVAATLTLAAPSPVTATPGDGVVTLSWDAVAGATSYLVYRSSTSGGPYTQASNPFSGTSLTLGQSVNTPCYYVVVSRNDGGTSAYSNEVAATLTLAAPSPVTATPGDGVVTLSWDAVAGATSYLVYRSSTSGGPYTQASNPFSGTSLTLGQSVNTPCYYVVVSRNDGGTSAYSNEVAATLTLAAPSPVTATPGDGVVTLSWDAVAGATSYLVYRSSTSGGPYTQASNPFSGTSLTLGQSVNTPCYYVVVSRNDGGTSAYSNEVAATLTLAAPGNLHAVSGSSSVALTWDAVAGATSYLVYRSSTSGGPYTQASNPFSGTSLTLGQSVNTPCYYVVVSRNSGGTSAYSNETVGVVAPQLATVGVALEFLPTPSLGGANVTGLLISNSAAPAGGETFDLACGSPLAAVPPSVVLAAGSTAVTFPITTSAVSAPTAVTVTVSSGAAQTFTAALTLLPHFSVIPDAASLTLAPGAGTSSTIRLSSQFGFAGSIDLSLGGLPTGLVAWFYPPTVPLAAPLPGASTSGISSTLFFSCAPGTAMPSGQYTLTVTGTSGAYTASSPLMVTVP